MGKTYEAFYFWFKKAMNKLNKKQNTTKNYIKHGLILSKKNIKNRNTFSPTKEKKVSPFPYKNI